MDVRKPDVRFGYPDENMSGFRIVRISDVRFTTNRPDFRRRQLPERPITGRYIRISNARIAFGRPITGQYCPDFRRSRLLNRFGTGSEPVLVDSDVISGFQTFSDVWNRTFMSGYRTFGQLASSEIRTLSYEPDVRNPDNSKSGQIYVRFSKPDVRYSDVYCMSFLGVLFKYTMPFLLSY